jgi:hypothetical protein
MEEVKMGIFETLKSMVGCMYISDLRFGVYNEIAKDLFKTFDISKFNTKEFEEVRQYIGV